MQITILTYGTRGDVEPFLALAFGLQQCGHKVRLALPQRFAALAAQYHIPTAPLPGDPQEISHRANDASNMFATIRSVAGYIFSISGDVLRAAVAACADADLIIHSYFFTTGGHSLARAKGIPDISVQLFPIFAPTRAFPSVAMPDLPPGERSYLSHQLVTQLYWRLGNLGYRRLMRADPGAANFKLEWPFDEHDHALSPLLFAYSPALLPRPSDWTSPHIHITGSFNLPTLPDYQPPQKMVDFLAAGEAPVCISFGSMLNKAAQQSGELLRSALQQTGQRAIFLTGWDAAQPVEEDKNLLYLEDIPHDWLFPQCKSIVHHGGAGTTHAALRAGIPNIVIPHAGDQRFWARRVSASGAGPRPLNLKHLSAAALIEAFAQADSREMRLRAKAMGQLICADDGVYEAVRLIEAHTRQDQSR